MQTTEKLKYNEDACRVEFWNDDDIRELQTELDIPSKRQTTDFRDTINVWNSDEY